ncbi:MAG: hypothetical protein U9Q74_12335 [Gemmatimonadota bacterium]|nr:hypothetical protein [Gemmatimonadota bacterium]
MTPSRVPRDPGRATIRIDPSVFVGQHPFRHLPHPDPEILVRVLDRERIERAWVGYLPAAYHRDPAPGNAELLRLLGPHRDRLSPAPVVRPDFPRWEHALAEAADAGAAAIRAWPAQWRLAPDDARLAELACACGARRLPLILTVRLEDLRQRHPLDVAGDLQAAAVRALARAGDDVRLIVCAAGREFIEEVHWGLTPREQRRVAWDISWIWGPPEDHFAKLLRTLGPAQFVFGTQWPLRLVQAPAANLELLPDDVAHPALADPGALFD